MADVAHLEKMGRELKCPICLSLLNSAVSLSCDHVFCNFCISKSMKSASNCPVCKVPYRRREVRPAPHMDNLVSIYKSMEVASGINIFVTQPPPLTKKPDFSFTLKDGQNQGDSNHAPERSETDRSFQVRPNTQMRCKRKGSKASEKTKEEADNHASVKPSFPAKKRIQVPMSPPRNSETPVQTKKARKLGKQNGMERDLEEIAEKDDSIVAKEKLGFNKEGNTEEDGAADNGIPPQAYVDQVSKSPTWDLEKRSKVANIFDSEMFDWTQRACSPELCCTPIKKQIAGKFPEYILGKGFKKATEISAWYGNTESLSPEDTQILNSSCQIQCRKIQNGRTRSSGKKSRKNGKKINTQVQKMPSRELKRLERSINQTDDSVTDMGFEEVPTISCQNRSEETSRFEDVTENCMDMELPDLLCQKIRTGKIQRSGKKPSKNGKMTDPQALNKPSAESNRLKRSLGQTSNMVTGEVIENVPTSSSKIAKNKKIAVSENKQNLDGGSSKKSVRTVEIPPSSARDFTLQNCENILNQIRCAFCQTRTDSEASGPMLHYFNGKPVAADYNGGSNIIHSHKNCTEWAPNVYFEDETAKNLTEEIVRSKKIKCSGCGINGAPLGCFEKSCRKSFHVPCAKLIPQCRWDEENYVMFCPVHSSSELPKEISGSEKQSRKRSAHKVESKGRLARNPGFGASQTWKWPSGSASKWVLCCSALSVAEKEVVTEFTRTAGISVLKKWGPSITHVIASTDEIGACRRTLKVLMAILEGKWIIKIEWIKACMMKKEPVNEEKYEIKAGIHGIQDGPRNGRLRIMEKKPKLFNGFKFYFSGDFMASYKSYLHDLVIAAGGTVLHRKPIAGEPEDLNGTSALATFIICSMELPDKCDSSKKATILDKRRVKAWTLACTTGAKVANHTWILDSIAACKLQSLH